MVRDGWFKTTTNFVHLSDASEGNRQYNFFDGHNSHWDPDALDEMNDSHVHAIFLKAGDSKNDQPNDHGPNACFKSSQSAPIIRRSFQKLHLHPLAPPESKVAVTAAIECATGRKSVELGIVAKAQLQVDDVTVKRSNDPMVILRAGMKSNRNILV